MGERARPIRFGTSGGRAADRATLLAAARNAEALGYATFGMADHLSTPLDPIVALQAAADVTSDIRLSQIVLAQDFRHPAVLAKQLATLDVLSGGRLEVGIGAGWNQAEFEQAGIVFDPAPVRIERLEEAVVVLKGLFGDEAFSFNGKHFTITELDGTPKPLQRPHPPIMIGGGGRMLLAMAARHADIIQVLPGPIGGLRADPAAITGQAYREKIEWIRQNAGDRFDEIELSALLFHVAITDDPDRELDQLAARFATDGQAATISHDDLLASPVVAVGSLDDVCRQLVEARDTYGLSYFLGPVGTKPGAMAPIIDRVAGR